MGKAKKIRVYKIDLMEPFLKLSFDNSENNVTENNVSKLCTTHIVADNSVNPN